MSDLRKRLIRLAHENPELRADILPLLKRAHGPVALKNPDVMLFMINPGANNSKFYEMKIIPQGGGFLLQKRWGRLTDSGAPGRVDSKDETYGSSGMAQNAMHLHAKSKTNKGYKPAPNNEYPIGLGAAGFGWGGQAACNYVPELKDLHLKMKNIQEELQGFNYILAGLSKRKSDMAPKLTSMVREVSIPIEALDKYLDHQLSSC